MILSATWILVAKSTILIAESSQVSNLLLSRNIREELDSSSTPLVVTLEKSLLLNLSYIYNYGLQYKYFIGRASSKIDEYNDFILQKGVKIEKEKRNLEKTSNFSTKISTIFLEKMVW